MTTLDGSVSDDSDYAEDDYDDGMMLLKTPAVPPTNIENKMFAGKFPNPLPVSNPDPAERQLMIQTYKREQDEDGNNQDDLRISVNELGHFVKGSEDSV